MTSSKLFFYLSRLSSAELEEFKGFCASPFFNNSPNLLRILEAIEEFVLNVPDCDLNREAFFQLLYPQQKFNDGYSRKLLAELLQLFSDYLAHRRLKEDKVQKRVYFLKELNANRWWKYFESYYKKSRLEARKEHPESLEMHRMNILLDQEWFLQATLSPKKSINDPTTVLSYSLDQYFAMSKYYFSTNWATLWIVLKLPTLSFSYLEQMKTEIEAAPEKQSIGTLAYFYSFYSLWYPNDRSYYFKLKDVFLENKTNFGRYDAYEVGMKVLSYCAMKINAGSDVQFFQNEMLDQYEILLETGLILTDGKLDSRIYKTVVILGSRLGEFGRVETFMEEYKPKLTSNPYGIAVDYNQAILCFFKGEFAEARRLLNRILQYHKELSSLLYGMDARGYLCRTDYELGDLESLQYHGEAFNQFIRRNKLLTPRKKKSYLDFTRLLLRMGNIVNGNPQKRKANLDKFQLEIDKHGKMPFTKWLQEKLDEAKQRV